MPAVLPAAPPPVLVPGRTCGELARADRLAVIVDAAPYLRHLASSLVGAQRQILAGCWDLDAKIALWRGDDPGPQPLQPPPPWRPDAPLPRHLGDLLDELARRRLRLHSHLLTWDYGTLFAVKRQLVPLYHLDWGTHRRVQVRLDGAHPLGASMHMKAVAVDDVVAFVGGMDLSRYRWDRPGHAPHDPLRVDPDGHPYPPWHDQQWAVSGAAAAMVGRHLRDRWRLVTGRRLPAPQDLEHDPWPAGLRPDLHGVEVGLLRTEPAWEGRPERREIEQAWLALVERARDCILIENQYLTARSVAHALARRLAEPEGPEVIIITSRRSTGLLEQAAMDGQREHFVELLRRADRHDRLRVYTLQADADTPVKVHAKAVLMDLDYLQIGSANLANRSMGFDVELDLGVEARGAEALRTRDFLSRHRATLLAEHEHVHVGDVQRLIAETGSVRGALDRLVARDDARGLQPFGLLSPPIEVPTLFGDPETGVDVTSFAHQLAPEGLPRSLAGHAFRVAAGILLVISLQILWHGLPTGLPADADDGASWLAPARVEPLALLAMASAFVGGSIVPFPMALLVVLAGFAFGTLHGLGLTIAGTGLGCVLGWTLGRVAGRSRTAALGVPRLNALSRRLVEGGLPTIADLRLSPRHSFSEVNLVAGVVGVPLRDLLPGTVLGGLPGALLFSLLGAAIADAARHPGPLRVLLATTGTLATGLLLLWLWRRRSLLRGA